MPQNTGLMAQQSPRQLHMRGERLAARSAQSRKLPGIGHMLRIPGATGRDLGLVLFLQHSPGALSSHINSWDPVHTTCDLQTKILTSINSFNQSPLTQVAFISACYSAENSKHSSLLKATQPLIGRYAEFNQKMGTQNHIISMYFI